jgi:hypothetical protein
MKKVFHLFFCPLLVFAAMVVFMCWGNRELIGVAEAARPGPLTCGRVECPLPGPCQVSESETCVRGGGPPRCPALVNAADGTTCSDGNACSQVDTCQSGICTGESYVDCPASDECHDAGTCDPATGVCSNTVKPDNSACSGGACCAGACVNINVAQSTVPSDLYPHGVKAGYQSVAEITNCGACDNDCGGPNSCTTKLCVPSANGVGQCRSYDRAQCFNVQCGNSVVPIIEPACAGPDEDGDGLSRQWEESQTNPYDGSVQAPGIDLNCNGDILDADGDLIWHEPPSGDLIKDIYVQVNFMEGTGLVQDPVLGVIQEGYDDHAPPVHPITGVSALTEVKKAFARQNISLHIDPVVGVIPHHQLVYFPVTPSEINQICEGAIDPITGEEALSYFGVMGPYLDLRRRAGYHFVLSGHDTCASTDERPQPLDGRSGAAEIGGNDLIISLGSYVYNQGRFCGDSNADGLADAISCCLPTDCCLGDENNWDPNCGTEIPIGEPPYTCEGAVGYELCESVSDKIRRYREWAGTLMHELGHNLGLCHSGPADLGAADPCFDEVNHMPNHISSMNYLYQLPGILHSRHDLMLPDGSEVIDTTPSWRVDFSHGVEGALNEAELDETVGLNITLWPYTWDFAKYIYQGELIQLPPPLDGPVDWNQDSVIETNISVDADLNNDGSNTDVFTPVNEWQSLFLSFQCTPAGYY